MAKVVSRPNPRIMLGPVDMSCSFVVSDARHPDNPVLYASPTFCRLTGYSEAEIVGRNCRFLQSPTGLVDKGEPRAHTAPDAVRHIYHSLLQEKECQASLTNYRKDGSAFLNMVTVIPVSADDSDEITHFIGFQVDLSQHPSAILQKLRDGSYIVNYSAVNLGPGGIRDRRGRGVSNELIQMIRGGNQEPVGRESERAEIHNLVLDNTEDFIHVLSLKGSLLYAAPSISRVLGYNAQELIGGSIADLCHPADVVPVMRELKDASSTPMYQVSHPSSRLAFTPGFPQMSSLPTPPPPPPTSLLFRALHKDGHYVWIISRGRLHVEPGKGRKAVVLVGRRVDSGILDAVMSRTLETRISQPEPFGENGWGLIATNGIILFANKICSQRLGFSAVPTIAPSHALLTASASAHAYHQHHYMSPPDPQMFPFQSHQPHHQPHHHQQPSFQRSPTPGGFFSHIPATLVGRNISSLVISPEDRQVLQTLVIASTSYDTSVRKICCRVRGCYLNNNNINQQRDETTVVELRFYPSTPLSFEQGFQLRIPPSSIIFEMIFLPENRETPGVSQKVASIFEYNSTFMQERRDILSTDNSQFYQPPSSSLAASSSKSQDSHLDLEAGPRSVQNEPALLQIRQSTDFYSSSPKTIHSNTSSSQKSTSNSRSPVQITNPPKYDTPLFPLPLPIPQSPATPGQTCQTPSQSPPQTILLSSLSTSPTSETSWQYELTRLRFENEKMRTELVRLEKLRERARRAKFNSFQMSSPSSNTSTDTPIPPLKRQRSQEPT